ncbi:hypothetical protein Tco_1406874 [Tanacetum coccineum]
MRIVATSDGFLSFSVLSRAIYVAQKNLVICSPFSCSAFKATVALNGGRTWHWIGMLVSEKLLGLYWMLTQSVRWNPTYRRTFKQRLAQRYGNKLPGVDIFVCMADPVIEPPMLVISTVLSVMAYDLCSIETGTAKGYGNDTGTGNGKNQKFPIRERHRNDKKKI